MSLPDTQERPSSGPRRATPATEWDTPVYDEVVAEHGEPPRRVPGGPMSILTPAELQAVTWAEHVRRWSGVRVGEPVAL